MPDTHDSYRTNVRGRGYTSLLIAFTVALIIADIVTKLVVQASFQLGESIAVLGDTVRLTYIHNPRGAFGISIGSNIFHIVVSLIVVGVITFVLWRDHGRSATMDYSLAAVTAGALGNLVDRIRMGEVVDFMDVDIPDIDFLGVQMNRWPVFNIADACVTVGIIVIMIYATLSKRDVESDDHTENIKE